MQAQVEGGSPGQSQYQKAAAVLLPQSLQDLEHQEEALMASMHKVVMRARLPFSHQSMCQDQAEALKSGATQKVKSLIIGRGQDLQASRSSIDDPS